MDRELSHTPGIAGFIFWFVAFLFCAASGLQVFHMLPEDGRNWFAAFCVGVLVMLKGPALVDKLLAKETSSKG